MKQIKRPRILPIAVNPGIDRTMYFTQPLEKGEVNRAARVVQHGGCKSGNAACVMARLGADVTFLTFSGGAFGSLYERYYAREAMQLLPIETEAGVRLNVKLCDGEGVFTECNQKGGPVRERELADLLEVIAEADFDCLYLAGSLPEGCPTDFYADCVRYAKQKGAYTVVDADGEVLRAALCAAPDLIKPNRTEFEKLIPEGETLSAKIARFHEKYPETVLLLSLGGEGAVLSDGQNALRASALPVCVRGTVAAGDTLLSAFTVATLRGECAEAALKKATAAAAAKVCKEGTALPSPEEMQERIDEVVVTKFEFQDK